MKKDKGNDDQKCKIIAEHINNEALDLFVAKHYENGNAILNFCKAIDVSEKDCISYNIITALNPVEISGSTE